MLFATLSSSSAAASPVGLEGLKRISPFSLCGEDCGTGAAGGGAGFFGRDLNASLRTVGGGFRFGPGVETGGGEGRTRCIHAGFGYEAFGGADCGVGTGFSTGMALGTCPGSRRGLFHGNRPAYLRLPKLLLLAKDYPGRSQKEDSDSDAHYSGLLVAKATFQIFAARQISSASTT